MRQYVACSGPGEDQHAEIIGDVLHLDALAGPDAPAQLVEIVKLRRGGGEDIESVIAEPGHRDLGFDEAIVIEEMAQNDAAALGWDLVGADAIEEGVGIGTPYFEFGESGEIHEANILAHRERFRLDGFPPVRAAVGEVLALAGSVIPAGPFPAEDL